MLFSKGSLTLQRVDSFLWMGYVWDLRHKYYPDYFSARECLDTNILFVTMLRNATAVIVNTHAFQDDIETFFLYRTSEAFNLPFSAAPVSGWFKEAALILLNIANYLYLISSFLLNRRIIKTVIDKRTISRYSILTEVKMFVNQFTA